MRLMKKAVCIAVVLVVAGLANLACESKTEVSHTTNEVTATPLTPVLEGD